MKNVPRGTRAKKPHLTVAEVGYFCDVDVDIRRGAYGTGAGLEQAFSDCHDGGLYIDQVEGLIRKRLLRWVPINDAKYLEGDGLIGYGAGKTVDMTDRAMRVFWPKLYAERVRSQSPQSAGGIARAKHLSPERRSEIAQRAAQARWQSKGAGRA